ncbi:MAG TPA: hypothetical protein VNN20_17100 [Thermodesulfobacteriota bacterium]|nr:hypothetical protein [Thermodesulfobacteriota bacterium]
MGKLKIKLHCLRALILACFLSLISCDDGLEPLIFEDPIFCDSGAIDIREEGANLIINADNQGDCIRAEGTCIVTITAEDVILNGCIKCIDASDEAEVVLSGKFEDVRCTSIEDGIRASGDAVITLVAGDDVVISSGQGNGIVAENASLVELIAADKCRIEAAGNAILESDTAEVDTSGCNEPIIE